MKVEKKVGWLKGGNGVGNVFELSHQGGHLLAMIWQDGNFHYLSVDDLKKQIQAGTAAVPELRETYLPAIGIPQLPDGSLTVENPSGWERLYTATVPGDEESTVTKDEIVIPFTFSGTLKIDVSGLAALIKLIE